MRLAHSLVWATSSIQTCDLQFLSLFFDAYGGPVWRLPWEKTLYFRLYNLQHLPRFSYMRQSYTSACTKTTAVVISNLTTTLAVKLLDSSARIYWSNDLDLLINVCIYDHDYGGGANAQWRAL